MYIHVRYVLVPELLRNRLSLHQQHFHLLILILTLLVLLNLFYFTLLYCITKGMDTFRNTLYGLLSAHYRERSREWNLLLRLLLAVTEDRRRPAGGLILHLFYCINCRIVVSYYAIMYRSSATVFDRTTPLE